jgi:hypothetical protein
VCISLEIGPKLATVEFGLRGHCRTSLPDSFGHSRPWPVHHADPTDPRHDGPTHSRASMGRHRPTLGGAGADHRSSARLDHVTGESVHGIGHPDRKPVLDPGGSLVD